MGSLVEVKMTLSRLTAILDFIELAKDHDVGMTEEQHAAYLYLQSLEAGEIISNGSN